MDDIPKNASHVEQHGWCKWRTKSAGVIKSINTLRRRLRADELHWVGESVWLKHLSYQLRSVKAHLKKDWLWIQQNRCQQSGSLKHTKLSHSINLKKCWAAKPLQIKVHNPRVIIVPDQSILMSSVNPKHQLTTTESSIALFRLVLCTLWSAIPSPPTAIGNLQESKEQLWCCTIYAALFEINRQKTRAFGWEILHR